MDKLEVMECLRAQGVWNEASLYREETRKRLKSEGKSKDEANRESWGAMLAKYPLETSASPNEPASGGTDSLPLREWTPELERQIERGTAEIPDVIHWVISHLDVQEIPDDQIPPEMRGFAANIRRVMARNPAASQKFIESYLHRLIPKQDKEEQVKAFLDDGGVLDLCEKYQKVGEQLQRDARRERQVPCPSCGTTVEWPE